MQHTRYTVYTQRVRTLGCLAIRELDVGHLLPPNPPAVWRISWTKSNPPLLRKLVYYKLRRRQHCECETTNSKWHDYIKSETRRHVVYWWYLINLRTS